MARLVPTLLAALALTGCASGRIYSYPTTPPPPPVPQPEPDPYAQPEPYVEEDPYAQPEYQPGYDPNDVSLNVTLNFDERYDYWAFDDRSRLYFDDNGYPLCDEGGYVHYGRSCDWYAFDDQRRRFVYRPDYSWGQNRTRWPRRVAQKRNHDRPYGNDTHGRPARPNGQPSYPNGQPAYPNGQPARPQPTYPQGQPSYPQGQPSYPQGQPSYPQPQPTHPQPSYPQPQPAQPQPTYPQPSYPQAQPANPQPSYPSAQPAARPAPVSYGNDSRPVAVQPSPVSPQPEPALRGQTVYSNAPPPTPTYQPTPASPQGPYGSAPAPVYPHAQPATPEGPNGTPFRVQPQPVTPNGPNGYAPARAPIEDPRATQPERAPHAFPAGNVAPTRENDAAQPDFRKAGVNPVARPVYPPEVAPNGPRPLAVPTPEAQGNPNVKKAIKKAQPTSR